MYRRSFLVSLRRSGPKRRDLVCFKTTVKQRLGENRYQTFVLHGREENRPVELVDEDHSMKTKALHTFDDFAKHFLPKEYPSSVSEGYLGFARGQLSASIFGSAGGVLAMQSLLYAVGLGAGSIPLAATVNWVLRDGLGQLGGVIFSSVAGSRFDADPKRWRILAAVALEVSTFIELLTPLKPSLFLFIASIANIGKNISYLAASASRAAIHKSFAINENLADVTAKTGSQTIFSSTVGTGLGISLAALIGNEYAYTVAAFGVLSSLSLMSTYYSVSHVTINTLSLDRLECLLRHHLSIGEDLDLSEALRIIHSTPTNSLYEKELLTPQQMRQMEELLSVPKSRLPPLTIGADWKSVVSYEEDYQALVDLFPAEKFKFVVSAQTSALVKTTRDSETFLLLRDGATLHDAVMGLTVAFLVRLLLLEEGCLAVAERTKSLRKMASGGEGGKKKTKATPEHLQHRMDIVRRAMEIASTEVFPGITLCHNFADRLVSSEQSPWLGSTSLLETRLARLSSTD